MITNLSCGALGVQAEFPQAVELAAEFGFQAVEPDLGLLLAMSEAELAEEVERLAARGLRYGPAGIPVDLRAPAGVFAAQLAGFGTAAARLAAAGIDRAGMWICPQDEELTYRRNFRRHAERVALVAEVAAGHGIRVGLEYVGPKTSWSVGRFPFIHSLAETRELIEEAGQPNVGLVLDAYHWYTAGESAAEIRELRNEDVVWLDVSDAPLGRERDEQMDLERELPGATGVIDLAALIGALREIGCDAPVKVEPFNAELRALPPREAVRRAAEALHGALKG